MHIRMGIVTSVAALVLYACTLNADRSPVSTACKNPIEPVEHIICADTALSSLDQHTTTLFSEVVAFPFNDRQKVTIEQQAWLKSRYPICRIPITHDLSDDLKVSATQCLKELYSERLGELEFYRTKPQQIEPDVDIFTKSFFSHDQRISETCPFDIQHPTGLRDEIPIGWIPLTMGDKYFAYAVIPLVLDPLTPSQDPGVLSRKLVIVRGFKDPKYRGDIYFEETPRSKGHITDNISGGIDPFFEVELYPFGVAVSSRDTIIEWHRIIRTERGLFDMIRQYSTQTHDEYVYFEGFFAYAKGPSMIEYFSVCSFHHKSDEYPPHTIQPGRVSAR
jgi:uncharacterized protein YecT (DUF1311 family)